MIWGTGDHDRDTQSWAHAVLFVGDWFLDGTGCHTLEDLTRDDDLVREDPVLNAAADAGAWIAGSGDIDSDLLYEDLVIWLRAGLQGTLSGLAPVLQSPGVPLD